MTVRGMSPLAKRGGQSLTFYTSLFVRHDSGQCRGPISSTFSQAIPASFTWESRTISTDGYASTEPAVIRAAIPHGIERFGWSIGSPRMTYLPRYAEKSTSSGGSGYEGWN